MAEDGAPEGPLDIEEIREIIAMPRAIPRNVREEIAGILYREIVLGEDYEIRDIRRFIGRLGAFYLIFMSLKASEGWPRLKSMAGDGQLSHVILLRIILASVLDFLENPAKIGQILENGINEEMLPYYGQFMALLESTIELWLRRVKGGCPIPVSLSPAGLDEEGLALKVEGFHDDSGSRQFLAILAREALQSMLEGVSEVEEHLESLDILSLLFPGRGWDQAMLELHRAYYPGLSMYSRLVERNEELRRLADIIGRSGVEPGVRRLSPSGQGLSELYSVMISGDIQHMLPVESVKLQDETLKAVFFASWLERKLLTYQLAGYGLADSACKKRGPMVALVDTSGSMHGAPETVAKSIILAIVRRMLKEGRDVKIFLFSSVGQSKCIELTGSRKMASEFLGFLSYTFEGGTDFNTALGEGLDALTDGEYENADLLFITDGLSSVSDDRLLARLEEAKKRNGTRLYTILVGNDDAGGLGGISDRVFILVPGMDILRGNGAAIKLISAK